MRRVNRSLRLALLAIAIGIVVTILLGNPGGGGGAGDGAGPDAVGTDAASAIAPPTVLTSAPRADAPSPAATPTPPTTIPPPLGRSPRTVRILGPDGAPVPFARVGVLLPRPPAEVAKLGAMRIEAFIDVTNGRFERRDPERPGTTYVVLGAAASADAPPLDYAPARVRPDASTPHESEVRLEPGLTIEGRVVDGGGRGIDGILVEAYPVEARQDRPGTPPRIPLVLAEAHSDAYGAFVLRAMGNAPVLVVARTQGMLLEPGSEATVAGGARDVQLVLRAGREVRITVLDPDGRPIAGARVFTSAADSRMSRGLVRVGRVSGSGAPPGDRGRPPAGIGLTFSNGDGVALLVGLDPYEEVALDVSAGPLRPGLLPVRLPRWRPADSTIRLEAAHVLRGRVTLPDGSLGPTASIERFDGTRWERVGSTGKDGGFELRGLPAGPWTLRAALFASTRVGPEVVVADETTEVRLVLPEAEPAQK